MIAKVRLFLPSCRFVSACILLAPFLGACVTQSEPWLSKLDPRTMVTINYIKSPFIFFRTPAASLIDARDYVYLGPVEVNRSGDYRYYLWLATWNTMDTAGIDQPIERLESIDLFADGNKVTLKMNTSSTSAVGASEAIYPRPVGWASEMYYDVTLEQLRTISQAAQLQVAFPFSGETYGPWDDQRASQAGLAEFLRRAEF